MEDILAMMLDCIHAGLSVIPVGADGSKSPAPVGNGKRYAWTAEKTRIPSETKVRTWHRRAQELGVAIGYAVLGGVVSGNLTIIDVDAAELYSPWSFHVESDAPGLLDRLPRVKTPNGYHVYFRTPSHPAGNTKLAVGIDKKTLIETRGDGGYVVGPGSPGECHPSGRPYEYEAGSPPITQTPVITDAQRDVLFDAARALGQAKEAAAVALPRSGTQGMPGSDFNVRGSWDDILPSAGWTVVRTSGVVRYWRRPGKTDAGSSATTGFCKAPDGRDLLHVFSSNAAPFEADNAYGMFSAYAILHHGGDYKAAAAELRRRGYGDAAMAANAPPMPDDPSLAAFEVRRDNPVDITVMNKLLAIPVVARLWEKPTSEYYEAEEQLMMAAFHGGWTAQQVADLMAAYRQRAGKPLGDAVEYRTRMLAVLRKTETAEAVRNLKSEAFTGDGGDPAAKTKRMLEYLSKAMRVKVERAFQVGREDASFGITIDGVDVMLKRAADVLSMGAVRANLMGTTRAVLPTFKVHEWHQIVSVLLTVCEIIDEEETNPVLLLKDWLSDYVSRYSYYSDENYQNAIASNLPYRRSGNWHVKVDAFLGWIAQAKPRLGWSFADVTRWLKVLGGEPVAVGSRRHGVTRRYWAIPAKLIGDGEAQPEAEIEDLDVFP